MLLALKKAVLTAAILGTVSFVSGSGAVAQQERLPWQRDGESRDDGYRAPPPAYGSQSYGGGYGQAPDDAYAPRRGGAPANDAYRPPAPSYDPQYSRGGGYADNTYRAPGYGQPYSPQPEPYDRGYGEREAPPPYANGPRRDYDDGGSAYSESEIMRAGHGFFGTVSKGLASVIEYAFKRQGRPNGYILGEDAGGAFIAGLRYGEGALHTKDAGSHRVYWQGPSIGYDAGAEGSKVMVLVYNLRDPSEIYQRFGGVAGSAYVVGGVGLTFQAREHIVLAPIRSGIGLRLGANIGYLKYSRRPTWNPF